MIVVDTNVLAYLYLPCAFTAYAEALLEHDAAWAAPVLWRSEFRNILAGYMRRGSLSKDQAWAIQMEAESLMIGHEQAVDSKAVLELVNQSDCSAYDCEFIAVAHFLHSKLVTMDKQLLRSFPETAVQLDGWIGLL